MDDEMERLVAGGILGALILGLVLGIALDSCMRADCADSLHERGVVRTLDCPPRARMEITETHVRCTCPRPEGSR
jgi:hypothetical protein